MSYRFLEHTADVKFRAEGATIEEMFVEAAGALNETIRGNIMVLKLIEKSFEIKGKDRESLLYGFLEEILVLLDSEDFLVSEFKDISIVGDEIRCVVIGDKAENYKFTNDVKAVTYSDMFVKETEKGWECQVVLDV